MREIKFRAWSGDKMFHSFTMFNGTVWDAIQDKPIDWPIMQFSGLKDLKDKDIYEGDVLEITMKLIGNIPIIKTLPVIFQDGCLGVLWDGRNHSNLFNFSNNVTFEVKGNIHEHPELLK